RTSISGAGAGAVLDGNPERANRSTSAAASAQQVRRVGAGQVHEGAGGAADGGGVPRQHAGDPIAIAERWPERQQPEPGPKFGGGSGGSGGETSPASIAVYGDGRGCDPCGPSQRD